MTCAIAHPIPAAPAHSCALFVHERRPRSRRIERAALGRQAGLRFGKRARTRPAVGNAPGFGRSQEGAARVGRTGIGRSRVRAAGIVARPTARIACVALRRGRVPGTRASAASARGETNHDRAEPHRASVGMPPRARNVSCARCVLQFTTATRGALRWTLRCPAFTRENWNGDSSPQRSTAPIVPIPVKCGIAPKPSRRTRRQCGVRTYTRSRPWCVPVPAIWPESLIAEAEMSSHDGSRIVSFRSIKAPACQMTA